MYKGDEEAYWNMRPTLAPYHRALLNCYYIARRESSAGEICRKSLLLAELETCPCEPDIGLKILQRVDDYYLSLYREKLKRLPK